MTPAPHRPSLEISQEVAQLTAELTFLQLPNLHALERNLQSLTTQATLHPEKRGELFDADQAYKNAVQTTQKHAALTARLSALKSELATAQYEENMANITLHDQALSSADDEYRQAAKSLARAYRRLLNQQRQSQRVKGAKTAISPGFDFPPFNGSFNSFTTAQTMSMGFLPWENMEREQESSREAA